MSVSTWQPIASAPRDGTWFIICRAGEPESVQVGCFDPLMSMTFELADDARGLYRKVSHPLYDWRGFDNFHRATHWAALPDVPEKGSVMTDIERTLYGRPRCVWRPETDCLPECEYGIRGPCVAEERAIKVEAKQRMQSDGVKDG